MAAGERTTSARPAREFPTTHWSVVRTAGVGNTTDAREALAALCEAYWHPLYAYIRRTGYTTDDAKDLTQQFFTCVLQKNYLQQARSDRGRFRSFLLASLKHFLANERHRAQAQKRGGEAFHVPLEFDRAERQYLRDVSDEMTPERLYERRFALTLFNRVTSRLRDEFAAAGKSALFSHLGIYLTGEKALASYVDTGARLGMSESAVKMAVLRLRRRYRELLRQEIAQTVKTPEQIESEFRYLRAAIRS